jgi:hypothetical protein
MRFSHQRRILRSDFQLVFLGPGAGGFAPDGLKLSNSSTALSTESWLA